MPNDEVEFEKTLEGLPEAEQGIKRLEFKAQKGEQYRETLNIQNRILEKEGFEFKDGKWEKKAVAVAPVVSTVELSPKDAVVLAKSDVAEEDVDEVMRFAGYNKTSITETLKDPILQGILKDRVEKRKTANATTINPVGRQAPRETAESIVDGASQGNLPDSDEGISRLVASRVAIKKAAKQQR